MTLQLQVALYRAQIPLACDNCLRKSSSIAVGHRYVLTFDHSPCEITRADGKHHPCIAVTAEFHEECWEAEP